MLCNPFLYSASFVFSPFVYLNVRFLPSSFDIFELIKTEAHGNYSVFAIFKYLFCAVLRRIPFSFSHFFLHILPTLFVTYLSVCADLPWIIYNFCFFFFFLHFKYIYEMSWACVPFCKNSVITASADNRMITLNI